MYKIFLSASGVGKVMCYNFLFWIFFCPRWGFEPLNHFFVTVAGLTNDERCSIHILRVEKHWS